MDLTGFKTRPSRNGFNQGAPLAPAVYVFSLSVVAGAFVLAISGRGFPTLRRFLTSLPRRPYLVMNLIDLYSLRAPACQLGDGLYGAWSWIVTGE